ncbi:5-(carboxyamino)imidazole ribonucleotide synthase [Apilactobacillus sp. TMW 2.2459]|uniref:5-(carboxyamino)imidazole ribonucleotide synthase n=1 Tax=Apilactobacillus xinyiensis TaxID=2841032 RepID=UPI001C7D74DC|nr:5-(carboxyamino)imidazole ribonucleotide synthase [Apilactobacillus xinyiensis]MCL0311860.1 5-(carboxyamino)imidazole ribonucleotide synthase [Apilactobacillus xinyiensis]MCL0318486.1 5-(carboxyamino)imidazole ribonucleotide synthase [Apilactobacillus xinyiensis]
MSNLNKSILPPATIGIIGGGQLGQMMALSAKSMGYKVGILDPTPNAPAGQVSDFQIVAEYSDEAALQQLAEQSDVLTYEFENVDQHNLAKVENITSVPQKIDELVITSNRLREKSFLSSNDIPVTPYARVTNEKELYDAVENIGRPGILKTTEGGYDGHGQIDINDDSLLSVVSKSLGKAEWIYEKKQSFVKEVSMIVTRDFHNHVLTFPLSENIHRDHILHTSIIPARVDNTIHQKASAIATKIASSLELYGVLGIEFFVLNNDELLVNELAPRPHNSGHYSIEACNVSQFEAHIRSICGLEIPSIQLLNSSVMVNMLGDELTTGRNSLPNHPEWHFHDYGKAEIRPKRKMGHITVVGDSVEKLLKSVEKFR